MSKPLVFKHNPAPMRWLYDHCRSFYAHRSFRVLFLLNILLGFAYSFVAPFMSMFGTIEVGMSKVRFGIFMTVTAVSGILIGTTLARFSDTHFSRRAMLLLGSISGMFGYIGFAYCRSFSRLILISTVVIGISTVTFSQLFAYARESLELTQIDRSQRVLYMNTFRMFFALSWTVGPAIASWVMLHFSYRGLFLCAAANFALFAIAVVKYVPSARPLFAFHASKSSQSLLRILARVDLVAHLTAIGLVCAAMTMGMVNLPLLILETLKGTQFHVGITYSVAPVFELPFMLYFGWLATRRDSAGILRAGMVIGSVYFVFLALVAHPWQVYICQILSAATTAVVSGIAITYFQSHLPHHPGTATNLYANAQRIGSTGGYFLFGFVAEQLGYRVVFGVCAVLSIIGLGLMFVPIQPPSDTEQGTDSGTFATAGIKPGFGWQEESTPRCCDTSGSFYPLTR